MPGRTPQSPDDRGTPAPAPTDSGICAISPSDLVGYTGNLINRVDSWNSALQNSKRRMWKRISYPTWRSRWGGWMVLPTWARRDGHRPATGH